MGGGSLGPDSRHCEERRAVWGGATKQSPDIISAKILLDDCVRRLLRRAHARGLGLLAMTAMETLCLLEREV